MDIIINSGSMVPIYEQIMDAVKKKIAEGSLGNGDPLPSVRSLSSDLKISALTVKKAYDRLEEEGLIATVHGKGSYVTGSDTELISEQRKLEIENELGGTFQRAKMMGISAEELRAMTDLLLEDY